ncbi:unnamed protein product [Mesocestoides corti]|nr:unnamed protein product [Mesocestoides corti]
MKPSRQDINVRTVYIIICVLWLLAFILSTPVGVFATLPTADGRPVCSEVTLNYSMRITKLVYSILGMVLLYGTPVTLVSIAYAHICILVHKRINKRPYQSQADALSSKVTQPRRENTEFSAMQESSPNRPTATGIVSDVGPLCNYFLQRKLTDDPANVRFGGNKPGSSHRRPSRHRRTSFLLASVAVFFAISWLPLNIVNLFLDLRELNFQVVSVNQITDWKKNATSLSAAALAKANAVLLSQSLVQRARSDDYLSLSGDTILIIQAVCLLLVLISACINPMLYGWLNENFRRRFKQLLRCPNKKTIIMQKESQLSKAWPINKKRSPYALWPRTFSHKPQRRNISGQFSLSTYHPTSQKTSSQLDVLQRSRSLDVAVCRSSSAFKDGAPASSAESQLSRGVLLETDIDAN